MKIKEIIVVEGKKDTANLKRWLDVDTLETSGTGLTEATLDQAMGHNPRRDYLYRSGYSGRSDPSAYQQRGAGL